MSGRAKHDLTRDTVGALGCSFVEVDMDGDLVFLAHLVHAHKAVHDMERVSQYTTGRANHTLSCRTCHQ